MLIDSTLLLHHLLKLQQVVAHGPFALLWVGESIGTVGGKHAIEILQRRHPRRAVYGLLHPRPYHVAYLPYMVIHQGPTTGSLVPLSQFISS